MSVWSVILALAFIAFMVYLGVKSGPPKGIQPKPANPHMVCKFCNSRGTVKVRDVRRKQGISGGKATGALFTAGISMLATGLSRKQRMKRLTCSKCGMEWDVE